MDSTVLLNVDPRGVATLTLNRPDRHNALDDGLVNGLREAIARIDNDPDIRVVVLAAAGRSFCAGADLGHMQRMIEAGEEENSRDAINLAICLRALAELGKPVVARIHGNVFGGGIGLLCCADIAISASQVTFCLSEVRLGLAPAVIAPFVLASVGPRQMGRLMLTAASIDAAQARDIGLIHQHVDLQDLDAAIEREVSLLLQGAPLAQQAAKHLLRDLAATSAELRDAQSARHAAMLASLRAGAEGREGLRAFLEKRKPYWMS